MRRPPFLPSFLATGLLAVLLTACGKKPDGTPYGVDPAKLPAAREKAAGATMYKKDMPKGAELNAVTNAARVGQPTSATQPLPAPPAR